MEQEFNNIVLRVMVANYDDKFVEELIKNLNEIMILHGDKSIIIKFEDAEPYWKFPEETECFFEIKTSDFEFISSLIMIFPNISWDYASVPCFDYNGSHCHPWVNESAVWDQNLHPAECFFNNENITWVEICTKYYSDPTVLKHDKKKYVPFRTIYTAITSEESAAITEVIGKSYSFTLWC